VKYPSSYISRIAQREIIAAWRKNGRSEALSNATYTDFYFDVIQPNPKYSHFNVYEVLDLLVNASEVSSSKTQEEAAEV
jgi:DNA-directed RNA polymerase specialized sigma24 family protein